MSRRSPRQRTWPLEQASSPLAASVVIRLAPSALRLIRQSWQGRRPVSRLRLSDRNIRQWRQWHLAQADHFDIRKPERGPRRDATPTRIAGPSPDGPARRRRSSSPSTTTRLAGLVFGHYDQNLAHLERRLGVVDQPRTATTSPSRAHARDRRAGRAGFLKHALCARQDRRRRSISARSTVRSRRAMCSARSSRPTDAGKAAF